MLESPKFVARWQAGARRLRREAHALWLAAKDSRTPWYARLLLGLVVAYALSPVDLIPDFVPILGYLDDLVVVPLGIAIAIRLVPADVLRECREQAAEAEQRHPRMWRGLVLMAVLWLALAFVLALAVVRRCCASA